MESQGTLENTERTSPKNGRNKQSLLKLAQQHLNFYSPWTLKTMTNPDDVKPHWVNSHWSKENLDGKTVEFRILAKGKLVVGHGKFLVSEADGQISVCIEVIKFARNWDEPKGRIFVPPAGVLGIERKELGAKSDFRCFYKS